MHGKFKGSKVQRFKGSKVQRFKGSKVQRVGIEIAVALCVAAKDFTDLVAWQLANALNSFVTDIAKRPAASRDFDYCRQAIDAAESAPRNIAEGFGRFAPKEFAHFLRIAIASEHETRNHIIKAAERGFVTSAKRDAGLILAKRAITAAVRLRRYLLSPRARANAARIDHR